MTPSEATGRDLAERRRRIEEKLNGNPAAVPVKDAAPLTDQADDLLFFAGQGVGGFRLAENGKKPDQGSHGHLEATTDPATIRRLVQESPRANWGLRPGPLPNGEHSFILDLDIKVDPATGVERKNGVTRFQQWCAEQTPPIDFTSLTTKGLVVRTRGGGLQIHLRAPRMVRQDVDFFGKKAESGKKEPTGIDTRTAKGYGIAPGSRIDGRAYTWVSREPMQVAPPQLVDALAVRSEETPAPVGPIDGIDPDRAAARAAEFLKTATPAIEGQGGEKRTLTTAMKAKDLGVDEATCFELMLEHFNPRCEPPWDADELRAKVRNAYRYGQNPVGVAAPEAEFNAVANEATDSTPTDTGESYSNLIAQTDLGNAALLVRLSGGNLRYVVETKTWIHWNNDHWDETTSRTIARHYAARVAEHYYRKAAAYKTEHLTGATLTDDQRKAHEKVHGGLCKWELYCQSRRGIDAMVDLASTLSSVEVSTRVLNLDPWLMGVTNGVVDLRTGTLRPAARDELITKHSPVAFTPTAAAPRFRQFIEEITGLPGRAKDDYVRRPHLATYLQRASGYCLTGRAVEDKMFIAAGTGANGKNEFFDAVTSVMGDYATTIPPEALMQPRFAADAERPTPNTAGLFGIRLALSSESKDGQKLDLAMVKRHTGGGFLTARRMRENTITFEITHKLILMTNVIPTLEHVDPAIKGRLHIIPFDRTWNRPGHPDHDPRLPDGDKGLTDIFKAESEGILAWLVEGAVAYHRDGLPPPVEVVQKTRGYFEEQDGFGQWFSACGILCEPKDGTAKLALLTAFNQWAQDNEKPGMTEPAFSAALKRHHFEGKPCKRDGRTVRLYGIRLLDQGAEAADNLTTGGIYE